MPKAVEQEINLLRATEIFVVVAETGSMTSAGAILGMTQSAISQQIHNLETSIGTPLFDRDLRPLCLTMAGSMMFERAKRLLLEANDLRAAMRSAFAIPIPHLRLGVLASVSGSLVAPLVFELLDKVAAKSVSVWTGFGSDHQRSLQNRALDLILIADPLYELAGLERHELFSEPFVLVVPPALAAEKISFASLLKSMPLIRHSIRSPVGMQIEQNLRRLRVDAPPYVEFDSIESIIAAVSIGRGWAVSTPMLLLQGLRPPYSVAVRPLPSGGFSRSFALIARSGELGNVPSEIARLARTITRDVIVPAICTFAPFVKQQFEIPTAGDTDPPQPRARQT
jgi:DNA-binding transcriptional LysR family regulator